MSTITIIVEIVITITMRVTIIKLTIFRVIVPLVFAILILIFTILEGSFIHKRVILNLVKSQLTIAITIGFF